MYHCHNTHDHTLALASFTSVASALGYDHISEESFKKIEKRRPNQATKLNQVKLRPNGRKELTAEIVQSAQTRGLITCDTSKKKMVNHSSCGFTCKCDRGMEIERRAIAAEKKKKEEVDAEIARRIAAMRGEADAPATPVPVQLLDFSIAEEAKPVGNLVTKTAQQIFMEEKKAAAYAKEKVLAKLTLLEQEVKLGQQLLLQSQTLLKSQQALLLQKVRVKYSKCHKFWRGKVVSAHSTFVAEQVDAAKTRLGVKRSCNKFNILDMIAKIDQLAPEGKYKSANPLTCPTSTSRPWVRKQRTPRSSCFLVPVLPIRYTNGHGLKSSSSPAAVPQTSAGIRGEYSFDSHGEVTSSELVYDHDTQLKPSDDVEFLWDGLGWPVRLLLL